MEATVEGAFYFVAAQEPDFVVDFVEYGDADCLAGF